jgi:putative transposase
VSFPVNLTWENLPHESTPFHRSARIIAILRECEAGATGKGICRRHGISAQTLYRGQAKFGGMQVCDARRRKQLERENARLKRRVADLTLDRESLQGLLGKTGKARSQATRGGAFGFGHGLR